MLREELRHLIQRFNSEIYFESRFRRSLLFRSLLTSCYDYSNELFYDSS